MSCIHRRCCWVSFTICNRTWLRNYSSSRSTQKNYYDSLEITPKASQGDIKQAYYKLSLKYHPDVTTGQGDKFREITAAYEVLGNLKLRRLYDRGALHGDHHPAPPEPSHHTTGRVNLDNFDPKRTKSPSTGRTAEFNYDDWSKAHYGRVFARQEKLKHKIHVHREFAHTQGRRSRLEMILLASLLSLAFGVSVMNFQSRRYDSPSNSRDRDR